jgi:hypothetical protein
LRIDLGGGGKGGLLERVGAALDQAIHGGDSLNLNSGGGAGGTRSGSNVVPFPMVNAYKPFVNAGAPISGLTAFPRTVRVAPAVNDGTEPEDEQSSFNGLSGLGFGLGDDGEGIQLPHPTKLQTVLGALQTIVPATIQSIRANPANLYPGNGSVYNPYATGGSNYPGQQGGAVSDVGQRVGGAVGGFGDTIGAIVRDHPYLVLAGGGALALWFLNPPRRRR